MTATQAVVPGSSQFHILVVEDSIDARYFALDVLEGAGYRVTAARLGQEAILMAGGTQFDLIFMDITLPDMTGYEVTSTIRAVGQAQGRPRTPIVALTSHTSRSHRGRASEAGMDGFLTKPIAPTKLLEAVVERLPGAQGPPAAHRLGTPPVDSNARFNSPFSPLVKSYLGRVAGYAQAINTHLEAGEWEKLVVLGHNLKGTGGTYGFPDLSALGAQLEEAAIRRNQLRTASTANELMTWIAKIPEI